MTKVWFIGAGPGDPDLLTLAGARHLGRSRTVYVFSPFDQTFAGLLAGKTVCNPFDYRFAELLALLEEQLAAGDVAFLVPGDLTFFCPFQALVDALGERAEVVPGVSTANAAAAFLKRTLNLSGSCTRTVIVSPRVLEETPGAPGLAELAAPGVTMIIYMNHLALPDLVATLRAGYGAPVPIVLVHRLGFEGQQVLSGTLDDIVSSAEGCGIFTGREQSGRSALTLVIVGETLTAPAASDWWDERCHKVGAGD
jgi:precorrin-4/cobalt-precorrin-4 C11-methyltransferase